MIWHGAYEHDLPEFKAAKFLANQYTPTEEEIRNAWIAHEGDPECAALAAHRLTVNSDNIRALRDLMAVQDLHKTEMEVAAIPRLVKPFNEDGSGTALSIRDAFKDGNVRPIKLNGKHSKGTAIAYDDDTRTTWLLKPGSR